MIVSTGRLARPTPPPSRGLACRGLRRGSLLAEVAMSSVLLMIAMTVTVKVLSWVGAERRAWDRRQWAAQEVANLMERATSRPFEEVTTTNLKTLKIAPQTAALLPGAELDRRGRGERPGGRTGIQAPGNAAALAQPGGRMGLTGAPDLLDLSREARPMTVRNARAGTCQSAGVCRMGIRAGPQPHSPGNLAHRGRRADDRRGGDARPDRAHAPASHEA